MLPIKNLSQKVSVSGSLNAADFVVVKDFGFDKVINFRPDNEVPGQLSDADARNAAQSSGLQYVHIPVKKQGLFTDEVVSRAIREMASKGRVLGYCASGLRAAIVWAAATARTASVDEVLSSLHNAGFKLAFIRDDLDAQAHRARWSDIETEHTTELAVSVSKELETPVPTPPRSDEPKPRDTSASHWKIRQASQGVPAS